MSSDSELAMVFVLRNDHIPDGHVAQEDAVDAAVRGMLMVLSDSRPTVVAAVEHWVAGPFAKIVKRARGRLWERIVELDELPEPGLSSTQLTCFSSPQLRAHISHQSYGRRMSQGCSWKAPAGHISLVRGIPRGDHSVMIVDARRTEVKPGSVTVAID